MSNLESLHNQVNALITSLVLLPLSEWLNNEKKLSVSVDELLEVLKLQKSKSTLSSLLPALSPALSTSLSIPVTSSVTSSSSVSVPAPGAKSRPKSKPPAIEDYTGPTCKYVFKRGDLKGKECGKPVVSGTEFCEQCSSKKTNKPVDAKQTKLTDATEKKTETKTTVGFTAPLSKKQEKPKIELRETGQPNTYIDTQTNIVVKKVVDKDKTLFVAVGVQEESGFRTLTEDEKKDALLRNFSLQTSDGKSENKEQTKGQDKKIVVKQPVNNIPDIESDED